MLIRRFVVDGAESELGILDLIQVSIVLTFPGKHAPYLTVRSLWNRWIGRLRMYANSI
jgi:hypothetical protein